MVTVLLFVLGLILLVAGAEVLVKGASRLALSFGISPLVVGLTVMAFGTSAPELAVSVQSAWQGQTDLAVANVVGSNIVNILLILGLSALIIPLLVDRQLIRQEVPIMVGASFLMWILALNGSIGRVEGAVLFAMVVAYTVFVIRQSRRNVAAAAASGSTENSDEIDLPEPGSWGAKVPVQLGMIVVGLILLVGGSSLMVDAAVTFARLLGVSEVVIGLTVVAIGTSLPEIAASITAAIRGQRDMAVGNVVGSNIFNILSVLGLSALVAPTALTIAPSMLNFDIPVMVAIAVACLPIFFTGHLIARWEGALFFGYYVAYLLYLVLDATGHAAAQPFGSVMLAFVLPITALTLAILVLRQWRESRKASNPAGR